jgi:DNA polymerase III delta prime subunit
MESTLEGKKCLSAIALFRELVKKNLDIYATLAEFIKYCIYEKSLHSFSVFEIKEALVINFGFSIPEIVIKNAIKRISEVNSYERNYIVKEKIIFREDFENRRKIIDENHKRIITEINNYISNRLKRDITESEKEEIFNTFFIILIQKKSISNQYSKYISFFIIENEKNEDMIKSLNIIKEGVLIYSAFQYTPEEYSKNTWTEELILYFDTELLFSIYGLNGKLYQSLLE